MSRSESGSLAVYARLWSYTRRYGWMFAVGVFGVSVDAAMQAAFVKFMEPLIDRVFVGKDSAFGLWLAGMIVLQALLVSVIGFGLGIGAAAWFGTIANSPGSRLAFYMPWEVFIGTALAVVSISLLSSLLSLQRVMVVEPAVVFQG